MTQNIEDLRTPAEELAHRIERLQFNLREKKIDGALIVQRVDLLYFAGTIQTSHLYIPAEGEPLLMVKKDFKRARSESRLNHVVPLGSPKQLPELIQDHGHPVPRILGMEMDVLPVQLYFNYRKIFHTSKAVDISLAIRLVRSVKSDYEIGWIESAAERSDRMAAFMTEILREGMTEIELAGAVEAYARKLGHQGVVRMRLWGSEMFYGHLMSGPAGAVSSFLQSPTGGQGVCPAVAQGAGFKNIERHEPVLLDYVFAHNGYIADQTRIFSLGAVSDELQRAHEAMLEVQEMLKEAAHPGVSAGEIYDRAISLAAAKGYADVFMGGGSERIRFVGHGVGLELDEFPFLAQGQELKLEEGMVIALEPKVVIPGKGVVGIENTHVVASGGLRQLGKFPEDVRVI